MPYEDFTTYTEYDPNTHIGKTAYHVDFQCWRNETAYLYKDYGADHFDDFEHLLTVKAVTYGGAGTGQSNIFWVLCNTPNEDYTGNAVPFINLFFYWDGSNVLLFLREKHSGGINQDSFTAAMVTTYYLTMKKDGTALTCKIYSDAARTNLLDTLSITLVSFSTARYLYIAQASHETYAQWFETDLDNLDLQEVSVTPKSFSDSGGGSDSFINPYRAMGFPDTGHGAEAFNTPFRSMGFADVGAGIDVFVIPFKALGFSDVGYGIDTFTVLLQKSFVDSGSGLDAFIKEVLGFITKNFSDIGQGNDVFTIPFKELGFSDSVHGTDVFIIPFKALGFSDSGHGTDAFIVLLQKGFADSGIGLDVFAKDVLAVIAKNFADVGGGSDVFARKNIMVVMLPAIIGMTLDGNLVITLKRRIEAES